MPTAQTTIPELTWSLVSPQPIYVEGTDPPLYWWHGVGLTEPMLLSLIGKHCFEISPTPEIKTIALRSQFNAERANLFGSQDSFNSDLPSEYHFELISNAIGRHRDRRSYTIAEVLSWIKPRT